MSNDPGHKVAIRIMDKEYLVGCPEGAEAELFNSADYLDQKMREIRDAGTGACRCNDRTKPFP